MINGQSFFVGASVLVGGLFAIGIGTGPVLGQVTCNPSFAQSKVDGSVNLRCGAGRADLQRIATSLEKSRREGRAGEASLRRNIATMNEILAASERRMSAVEKGMAELRATADETLNLLKGISQGRLQPGPQYVATRVSTGIVVRSASDRITLKSLWPNWNRVVEQYPELRGVYGQGPENLCMRCEVQANGGLAACRLAGAQTQPRLGYAARKMATLMRVYSPYGEYIGGHSVIVPITFGMPRTNQYQPRFCSMFAQADYKF